MRYKVTLTTEDGEVLEQWTVCVAQAAELNDGLNLDKRAAAQCFTAEVIENIRRADLRALRMVEAR